MSAIERRIQSKVVDRGLGMCEFIAELGVPRSTYYRKVRGSGGVLTLRDLLKIRRILQLNDQEMLELILLPENSQY